MTRHHSKAWKGSRPIDGPTILLSFGTSNSRMFSSVSNSLVEIALISAISFADSPSITEIEIQKNERKRWKLMRSLVQILSDAYEREVHKLRKNEEEHKKEWMKINVQFNLLRKYFQTFQSLLCHPVLSLILLMRHSNSTNFTRPFLSLN